MQISAIAIESAEHQLEQLEGETEVGDWCYEGVEYSVLDKRSVTAQVQKAARDTEIAFYERFPAFRSATKREYDDDKDPSKKYITSRWEELWKEDVFRSRWVLRDFAKTKGEGDFFNPTPSKAASELVHIRALGKRPHDSLL
jgi:hypothetical protein